MNLPFILDLALGLIFTYLLLSLLASEIQELVGAVLQWRAEHLKRSIEVLLSGNEAESAAIAKDMADALYESPWIKSLNQEARGRIARSFRSICHAIGKIYRTLTGTRNVFGEKTSGPSYIPKEAFANSLLDRLRVSESAQILVESRLKQFVDDQILQPVNNVLADLRASTANEFLLNSEIKQLEQLVQQILQDFQAGRVGLPETLERLDGRFKEFYTVAKRVLPENHHLAETFLRRLTYIQQNIASNSTEKMALLKKLQPSIAQLLDIFDDGSVTFEEFSAIASRGNPKAQELLTRFKDRAITPALKTSLLALANKVETTVDVTENRVIAFGREIEAWFDRGMERSTGVYKRNAKAVGLIIGFLIAISLNADSFHIATRLATDSALRSTITQAASQAAVNAELTNTGNLQQDLANLQTAVNGSLEQLPFPIGYSPIVLEQQRLEEASWPIPFLPRRLFGWLISAIAIGMGAGFWFDLLKKVVNIRTSGGKSGSSGDDK
ncbi:MAG TPA: hypothetical protein V6D07_15570 [Trichocoleus sp.]